MAKVTALEKGNQPRGSKKGSGLAHRSHEGILTGNVLFREFVMVEIYVLECSAPPSMNSVHQKPFTRQGWRGPSVSWRCWNGEIHRLIRSYGRNDPGERPRVEEHGDRTADSCLFLFHRQPTIWRKAIYQINGKDHESDNYKAKTGEDLELCRLRSEAGEVRMEPGPH